jgi:hypothetical protein
VRSFLARFEKDRDAVETRLDAETSKAKSASADSKGVLDDLRALVAAMEARTAEASYFLPPYDARACASATERLRFSLDAAAAALAPRAKFSFKKKKAKKTGKATPTATGDAGDTAGVSSLTRRERTNDERDDDDDENEENKKEKAAERHDAPKALDALAARVAAMAAAADASGFKDAVGETFVFRGDTENPADAPDLILERLSGCVVFVLGAVRALRCHDLRDTKVYGGPVAGSAHLQNLEGCHVEIAARQVRVHDARRVAFYVRTKSRPIIEHSREVTFAPFAFEYEGARARFAAAGLAEETDAWRDVDDFGWIKNRQSPNWRVAPESHRVAPPPPPPP